MEKYYYWLSIAGGKTVYIELMSREQASKESSALKESLGGFLPELIDCGYDRFDSAYATQFVRVSER